jgi:YidC/Oxa1 family membrane protein insertase
VARLPRILPYTTVASALVLPMALVVYLLTSSAWTLVENTLLRRGMPG